MAWACRLRPVTAALPARMGIAFWLAVMVVVHFSVLIACRRQPPDTPFQPELEHPDRPRLRRLGVRLLPIALAILTLAELGDHQIGPLRGEWAMNGVVLAPAALAMMATAQACWDLSWRRPRTRESTVFPFLLLGSSAGVAGLYGFMFVS